jgi:hypothetical protein
MAQSKSIARNLDGHHGPKTERGKAVTKFNAVKHGLESSAIVLPHLGETVREFNRHRKAIVNEYQAVGYAEELLAGRIASTLWHLGRVDRYRSEKTALAYENADNTAMDSLVRGNLNASPDHIRRAAILPDARSLEKADSHEAHLIRTLGALTSELRRLQGQRGVSLEIHLVPRSGNETSERGVENGPEPAFAGRLRSNPTPIPIFDGKGGKSV